MAAPSIIVKAGNPDFLDLPWHVPLEGWEVSQLVDLPKGISRHTVRFLETPFAIYAVKELRERAARNDYEVLGQLEEMAAPAVKPVGLVTGRTDNPHEEACAALITLYESFSFSYRELLSGPGFGPNRTRMLDAFAYLLVRLHLVGCYWGDCSLSNVLYRWDADAIETLMVDAETASVHPGGLSTGQRLQDVEIMIDNVAGGMGDIAARAGTDPSGADLAMGEEIAARYHDLWRELVDGEDIRPEERYRIRERMERINALGFDVEEVRMVRSADNGGKLNFKLKIGGRTFHRNRLRDLTGVEALENQARQILADLHYFQAREGSPSSTLKDVSTMRWRVSEFEPTIDRLRQVEGVADPIQAYCDVLHHRYVMAADQTRDVSTAEALDDWVAAGQPGYPTPR